MPELVLVTALLMALAGAVVIPPLRDRGARPTRSAELEAAELRHRVAIEALRDVEADHRAGSTDDDAYRAELAVAEERAVATRAALDAALLVLGRDHAGSGATEG
jgi:hypothetical protein